MQSTHRYDGLVASFIIALIVLRRFLSKNVRVILLEKRAAILKYTQENR